MRSRVLFTGGRDFILDPDEQINEILDRHYLTLGDRWVWGDTKVEVAHGGAVGFDSMIGEKLLEEEWHVQVFLPDYENDSKRMAPLIRNQQMVNWTAEADYGVCIAMLHKDAWNRPGGGTKYTIEKALSAGLDVFINRYDDRSTR